MTVTLADVATRAGVSAATVSRVLSGNYPVAGATRTRVLRAVEDLQYVVNGPASALAAATSDLVGVLVNDIADPFFGILAGAVQGEMGHCGNDDRKLAVVCNTGASPESELTYLTLLQRQRAAAVVVTGSAVADTRHGAALAGRLHQLAANGTRVVLCGRPPLPDPEAAGRRAGRNGSAATGKAAPSPDDTDDTGDTDNLVTIAFDNEGGAHRLTGHLLSLGHRRIGYVAGPPERTTTRDRLAGHRAAFTEQAPQLLPEADRLTVHGGGYDRSSGYDGARELLRREPATTAVLAANDSVALGVCAALRERGLRVPEDISVAGYDDLPCCVDAAPSLSTVRLPLRDAGARAGRLALRREGLPPGGVATLRGELVVRASTGPPPG